MLNKTLLCAFFTFALAAPAWAEDVHEETSSGAGTGMAAESAHAASGGLPQFDPTWFPSQIFWLAVCFGVLYLFFSKKTLPEISGVIENRRNHIQSDLDMAEKLTGETENVQRTYEKNLDKARSDASKAVLDVENGIKAEMASRQEAFRKRSESDVRSAETRIEKAKAEAMDEMNEIAAQAAREAVKKIIGQEIDAGKAKSVVTSLVKDRAEKPRTKAA
ncbi:MAG: hypothetical protein H6853_06780 [Rhodospirillales bacterium]|nr:hypothetical protein [Alphaproteobacteria bacterium]USO03232.1 MAG: hypothetical protein H6853_06780 [Rhodospirillales bacterium]